MDKTKRLIKIQNIIFWIGLVVITIVVVCNQYYYISNTYVYTIAIPLILVLYGMKIIIQIRLKRESKFKITLTPEQYKRISLATQNKNKSVDQFCIEAINEKLEKSI